MSSAAIVIGALRVKQTHLKSSHCLKSNFHYIPINVTPFELTVFWPSDIEHSIKLTFTESVSLSLKMRLMMLLNISQEMSNVPT